MNHDRTSGFYNETNQRLTRKIAAITFGSVSDIEPYTIAPPTNLNIFSDFTGSIAGLENSEVREQVKQVLHYLHRAIQRAHKYATLNNHLSRMNLVQQDDKAALLEWNFQDFRVGFSLEPVKKESSYFIISQDKRTDLFEVETQKLGPNMSRSIDKIVGYVLENT